MSTSGNLEGSVFKWTNYWGGWQPRWLVLQNGILSYYNSADEVGKGCRASIKISASDIVAYPNDNSRLDVVVNNEQRWFLKTNNAAERQAWLIALGTCKAGGSDAMSLKEQESVEAHGELRSCMSEVRLFCDLLVQQVVDVKQEAQSNKPDVQKLSDASTLLSTTCDTFLATLGRCLNISETLFEIPAAPDRVLLRSQSTAEQSALPQHNHKAKHKKRHTRSAGPSSPTTSHPPIGQPSPELPSANNNQLTVSHSETSSQNSVNISDTTSAKSSDAASPPNTTNVDRKDMVESAPEQVKPHSQASAETYQASGDEETFLTFFSAMLHSFSDIVLEEDGGIPTVSFLSACEGIIPFLDTIGSTAFAPVKMDFMGNITKLRTKQSSEPSKFKTLQAILHQEISTSTTKVRNSATDALMWLKRGLRFIQKFLVNFKNGERNLTVALNKSYAVTLKIYHGWVVKGIFALAVKAAPYPADFIRALSTKPGNADNKRFLGILIQDIDQYTTAMDVVLNIVDNYYEEHGLESNAVV